MSERSPLKHAGPTREDAVLHAALDAGDLEDRPAHGRQIAAQQAQPAGVLEGLVDREDHLPVRRGRVEPAQLLRQCLTGAGDGVAVEEPGLEKLRGR